MVNRAVNNNATAFGFLWILKQEYDNNNKIYKFTGEHWKNIYLFCVYTKNLIKIYTKSIELTNEFNVNPSCVTQAIKYNLIFRNLYFIRHCDDIINPPKPNTIFEYNGNYYTSFNE